MNKVNYFIKKLEISPSKVPLQYWYDLQKEIVSWYNIEKPTKKEIEELRAKSQLEKLIILVDDSEK